MLWNGSDDLKLVDVALNKSMKKSMELASRATAVWLNNLVFGIPGPVNSLARYLRATGNRAGECLLEDIIPEGFELSSFPYSDNESAAMPSVNGRYNPQLHLAIGMLRSSSPPQSDFRREPYIQGAVMLDPYGSLLFVMAGHILLKLSPILGEMFCNAKTPYEVTNVMQTTFTK